VLKGTYLLSTYSLGLGVPFLAAGLAVGTVSRYLSRLNRYLRAVELVSAALLIVIGVLIFTDSLTRFNEYFDFGFKEGV
jgi:cytochrome c-type biogenesis protein